MFSSVAASTARTVHPMTTPPPRRRPGEGRVAFLAHRDAIRAALLEGWPRTVIHERLRDKLRISYPQFMKYVDRYLPDALPSRPAPRAGVRSAGTGSQRAAAGASPVDTPRSTRRPGSHAPDSPAMPTPARFVHDPKPLSKERLV